MREFSSSPRIRVVLRIAFILSPSLTSISVVFMMCVYFHKTREGEVGMKNIFCNARVILFSSLEFESVREERICEP